MSYAETVAYITTNTNINNNNNNNNNNKNDINNSNNSNNNDNNTNMYTLTIIIIIIIIIISFVSIAPRIIMKSDRSETALNDLRYDTLKVRRERHVLSLVKNAHSFSLTFSNLIGIFCAELPNKMIILGCFS